MATAGTVTIRLDGDAATLIRELNKANKKTSKFSRDTKRAVKDAGKAFAVFSTATVAALAAITTQSIQTNQALADTARKLGLTTDALAGMRFAAEQTGVASNQLDLGVQRMTRRIAEAAKGTGEAQGALKELGLDAVRLAALPIDQQFQEISAAMANVTSQSDKIRLGFKLFDSEGVALINTLAVGKEGLEAFKQEAIDLGIALNNFETARIEQSGKAIDKAKAALTGLGNKLTVALAPAITVAAEEFADMVKNFNSGSGSALNSVKFLAKGFGVLVDVARFVKAAFQGVATLITALMVDVAVAVLAPIRLVTGGVEKLLEFVQSALNKLSDLPGLEKLAQDGVAALGRVRGSVAGVNAGLDGMIDSIDRAVTSSKDGFLETASTIGGASDAVDEFIKKIDVANAKAASRASADLGGGGDVAAGIDTESAKVAAGQLRDFLVQSERERIEATRVLQEDLLAAQFLGEEALATRKQEIAASLAAFEADQEIRKQELIAAARGEDGTLTEQERLNIRVNAELNAMNQITQANTEAAQVIAKQWGVSLNFVQKMQETTWGTSFNAVAGFFTKSKRIQGVMFKANKAFGIGNAIISTYRGVAKALELPFPANIAAAATTLSHGLAAVGSIKGASPGGGGGGGGISAAVNASTGGGAIPGGGRISSESFDREGDDERRISIIIQGDVNGLDEFAIAKIVPVLQNAVKDQDVILVDPRSRNAAEIADLSEAV